jgi:formylglycine-generating enzyme required for sulfatase activity
LSGALGQQPAQAPPRTLANSIGLELILIPAGEFDIDVPDSDLARGAGVPWKPWPAEQPAHRVRITRAFYLGKFEVTQEQYEKVMGKNPSFFSRTGPFKDRVQDLDTRRFPVEGVTWEEAQAFCAKLSNRNEEKEAGRVYRLPTSAEWEYACRAGTTTLFYSGNTVSFKDANFGAGTGGVANRPDVGIFGRQDAETTRPPGRTTRVGSYAPNPWGLYDLHGNVWEWCQDYFHPDYYKEKVKEDPQSPDKGYALDASARVVRGGSWRTRSNYHRSASRFPSGQVAASPGEIGFRIVCVPAASNP